MSRRSLVIAGRVGCFRFVALECVDGDGDDEDDGAEWELGRWGDGKVIEDKEEKEKEEKEEKEEEEEEEVGAKVAAAGWDSRGSYAEPTVPHWQSWHGESLQTLPPPLRRKNTRIPGGRKGGPCWSKESNIYDATKEKKKKKTNPRHSPLERLSHPSREEPCLRTGQARHSLDEG